MPGVREKRRTPLTDAQGAPWRCMPEAPPPTRLQWHPECPVYVIPRASRQYVQDTLQKRLRPLVAHHTLEQLRWTLSLDAWSELELWTLLTCGNLAPHERVIEVTFSLDLLLFQREHADGDLD